MLLLHPSPFPLLRLRLRLMMPLLAVRDHI
jgi:hypothetical protein